MRETHPSDHVGVRVRRPDVGVLVTVQTLDQIWGTEAAQPGLDHQDGDQTPRCLNQSVTRQKMSGRLSSEAVLVHPSDQPRLASVAVGYGCLWREQREAVGPVGGSLLQR